MIAGGGDRRGGDPGRSPQRRYRQAGGAPGGERASAFRPRGKAAGEGIASETRPKVVPAPAAGAAVVVCFCAGEAPPGVGCAADPGSDVRRARRAGLLPVAASWWRGSLPVRMYVRAVFGQGWWLASCRRAGGEGREMNVHVVG